MCRSGRHITFCRRRVFLVKADLSAAPGIFWKKITNTLPPIGLGLGLECLLGLGLGWFGPIFKIEHDATRPSQHFVTIERGKVHLVDDLRYRAFTSFRLSLRLFFSTPSLFKVFLCWYGN